MQATEKNKEYNDKQCVVDSYFVSHDIRAFAPIGHLKSKKCLFIVICVLLRLSRSVKQNSLIKCSLKLHLVSE